MPHMAPQQKAYLDAQWMIQEEYPGDPRTGSLGDVFGFGGTQRPGDSLPRNGGQLPKPPIFNIPSAPDLPDWPDWGDPVEPPPTIWDPPPVNEPPSGPPDLPPPGGVPPIILPPGQLPPIIIIINEPDESSSSGSSGSSSSSGSSGSSGSSSSSSSSSSSAVIFP